MPKELRRVDGESARTDEEVDGRRTRVTRVIDGDTVETAKLGRLRLSGVDAPEEWATVGQTIDRGATLCRRYRGILIQERTREHDDQRILDA